MMRLCDTIMQSLDWVQDAVEAGVRVSDAIDMEASHITYFRDTMDTINAAVVSARHPNEHPFAVGRTVVVRKRRVHRHHVAQKNYEYVVAERDLIVPQAELEDPEKFGLTYAHTCHSFQGKSAGPRVQIHDALLKTLEEQKEYCRWCGTNIGGAAWSIDRVDNSETFAPVIEWPNSTIPA